MGGGAHHLLGEAVHPVADVLLVLAQLEVEAAPPAWPAPLTARRLARRRLRARRSITLKITPIDVTCFSVAKQLNSAGSLASGSVPGGLGPVAWRQDVRNALLQVLDDGRLTDSLGRTVRFVDTVIIMTSNAGCDSLHQRSKRIGFDEGSSGDSRDGQRQDVLAWRNRPSCPSCGTAWQEEWNFPLETDDLAHIARHLLDELSQTAFAEKEVSLLYSQAALEHLAKHSFDATLGARPLRQHIQRLVEAPLAEKILSGELQAGDTAYLDVIDGALVWSLRSRASMQQSIA